VCLFHLGNVDFTINKFIVVPRPAKASTPRGIYSILGVEALAGTEVEALAGLGVEALAGGFKERRVPAKASTPRGIYSKRYILQEAKALQVK